MIQTKIELAKILSVPWENCERLYNKRLRKLMRLPDHIFIQILKDGVNFTAELIRKNTYIVTV